MCPAHHSGCQRRDWRRRKQRNLGSFVTAEEAALVYARHVGKERAAREAAEAKLEIMHIKLLRVRLKFANLTVMNTLLCQYWKKELFLVRWH